MLVYCCVLLFVSRSWLLLVLGMYLLLFSVRTCAFSLPRGIRSGVRVWFYFFVVFVSSGALLSTRVTESTFWGIFDKIVRKLFQTSGRAAPVFLSFTGEAKILRRVLPVVVVVDDSAVHGGGFNKLTFVVRWLISPPPSPSLSP